MKMNMDASKKQKKNGVQRRGYEANIQDAPRFAIWTVNIKIVTPESKTKTAEMSKKQNELACEECQPAETQCFNGTKTDF